MTEELDQEADWTDPVVEEVREAGRRIEAEVGGDVHAYFERLRRTQEKYRDRLVNKIERGPKPSTAA